MHPKPTAARLNPLEADSATAWARQLRARPPQHALPEHMLQGAFVALQAQRQGQESDAAAAVPEALSDSTLGRAGGSWCGRYCAP
jgi:hypothetical protein